VKGQFLDHLCLDCIHDLLTCPWPTRPKPLTALWTKALAAVWNSYYALFYTESELNESVAALPREHDAQRVDSTMARMEPWLLKRGLCRDRCGDANCLQLDCLLRLAACKSALK
jgi:hypothetical protein